jgi:cytochrome c oxidase subunit IV
MMQSREPTKTYAAVFLSLVLLLALTVAVSFVHLGRLNWIAALGISISKTLLIAYYFMHLRSTPRLTWMAAIAGCVMFIILVALVLADNWTRAWLL